MNHLPENNEEGFEPSSRRNWLQSADVYMNRLNDVKSNTYCFGAVDPRTLKATRTRLLSNGHTAIRVPDSSQISQRSAWGSDASIPGLIKQQSARSRGRPESAKQHKSRPSSGVKRRPQSAKYAGAQANYAVDIAGGDSRRVDVHLSEDLEEEGESILGVTGARYSHGVRPDHVSYVSGHVGYVPPSSGALAQTEEEIQGTVAEFLQAQTQVNPDDYLPRAPRSSPDLQEMEESSASAEITKVPQQLNLTMTLPNPDDVNFDPDDIPQQPDIHITDVPSKEDGNQPEKAKHKGSSFHGQYDEENMQTLINSEGQAADSRSNDMLSDFPEFDLSQQINALHHEIDSIQGHMGDNVENGQLPSQILENKAKTSFRKPRPQSAKSSVRIDEGENMTFDITPRSRSHQRPGSGRRDLRFVKSRIDSGVKMYPARPPSKPNPRRRPNSATYTVETAKEALASRNKPERPSSAKISTLNVEYIDSDPENESVDQVSKNGQFLATKPPLSCKPPSKTKPDVVTMMSQMRFSKDEQSQCKGTGNDISLSGNADNSHTKNVLSDESDLGDQVRPWSPTKFISAQEQNYYEIAMSVQNKKEKVAIKHESDSTHKLIKKTVKTIEISEDRQLKENKEVSLIGALEYENKEYVAPRPTSAKRPKSATVKQDEEIKEEKPKVVPENATKATHDAQGRRINRAPPRKPVKPAVPCDQVKVTDSEVWLENRTEGDAMEERPGSRLGFHVQHAPASDKENMININANSAVSKKNGATPGPSKCCSHSSLRTRPHSAHMSVRSHSLSRTMSRADNPQAVSDFFASEKNFQNNANFSSAKRDNRKLNKKYGKDASTPVVEIWTRKEDYTFETEGVRECKDIQERLQENGVPVDLKTLTRALLPPTEYGWMGPSYKTSSEPSKQPFSGNLISKPQYWLPEEYKRLKDAEKRVRDATAQLQAQQLKAGQRSASSSRNSSAKGKKKSGKKAAKKKTTK